MSLPIPEYRSWSSSSYLISQLYFECGKAGLNPDESGPYGTPLWDLVHGTFSRASAYAYLMDYRNYNLRALEARKSRGILPKPRIRLVTTITSHDNFSAKWYPTEYEDAEGNYNSDWRVSDDAPDRFNRPPNELMFVHGVLHLLQHFKLLSAEKEAIRHYVSYILIAAFNELKKELTACFEVELDSDIEVGQDEQGRMKWYLFDVEERKELEARQWIDTFHTDFGVPIVEFLRALSDPSKRNEQGVINAAKITKHFKPQAPQLTLGKVEKLIARIAEIRERWPSCLPHGH